jgi:hypothetical protein
MKPCGARRRQRGLHQRADAADRPKRDAHDGGHSAISADIDEALDDMLFAGGRLNVKLLGGAQQMAEA